MRYIDYNPKFFAIFLNNSFKNLEVGPVSINSINLKFSSYWCKEKQVRWLVAPVRLYASELFKQKLN